MPWTASNERKQQVKAKLGHVFCRMAARIEFGSITPLARFIANVLVSRKTRANYEKLWGKGTRPTRWWKIFYGIKHSQVKTQVVTDQKHRILRLDV